jgi:hypothetical protein
MLSSAPSGAEAMPSGTMGRAGPSVGLEAS